MNTAQKRLFLSHSSLDKTFANLLIAKLREAGVQDTWFDAHELTVLTDNISNAIEQGIRTADIFGILLSPAANQSQWVSYEVQAALQGGKPVAVLLHDAPNGISQFLTNPHINKLLQGGNHLVINLTANSREQTVSEEGFMQLLRAVAPEIGRQRETEFILRSILEDEDPDSARRAMSVAAMEPGRYLPGLLVKLPETRDTQPRYRVTRAMCLIGIAAIDPLCSVLTAEEEIASIPYVPNKAPDGYDEKTETKQYIGSEVVGDFLRHTIMFGGDKQFAAQKGAERCLVALAEDSASARVRILEQLRTILKTYMAAAVQGRDAGESFDNVAYDVVRLSLETLGCCNAPDQFDPWLAYQFLTTSLWGKDEARQATDKLSSYVVSCLSHLKDSSALTYLIELCKDSHQARIYFDGNTSPNPWEGCFVPFGNSAVPLLLKRAEQASLGLKMLILLNLAQIPNARAHRYVLDFLLQPPVDAPVSDMCFIMLALARSADPSICTQLLRAVLEDKYPATLLDSIHRNEVMTAMALAANKSDDQAIARKTCEALVGSPEITPRYWLIKTIADRGFHEFYASLFEWFESSPNAYVRTSAAISMSKNQILKTPEKLIEQMKLAAPEFEYPELALALSYFGDPRAIPGLEAGLRESFEKVDLARHEAYATALQDLASDEAAAVRAKWYNRI